MELTPAPSAQGEGEGERKRGRETSMCGCLLCTPNWGPDLGCNPGMCPDWESNQQPFGSQSSTQSTEPHRPGLKHSVLNGNKHSLSAMHYLEQLVSYSYTYYYSSSTDNETEVPKVK